MLFPNIPDNELKQAINTSVNQQTVELKKPDNNNSFGSEWAEITSRMAAERLGWRLSDFKRVLSKSGNNIAKTEQNNAAIVLMSGLRERLRPKALEIAREQRLQSQISAWKENLKHLGFSEIHIDRAIDCFQQLQLTQMKTGPIVNGTNLLELIARGIMSGEMLKITELHCVPRIMNQEVGFDIASDIKLTNTLANGKLEIADQSQEIEGFLPILNIMKNFGVPVDLEVLLMDLDTFILDAPKVEEKVDEFRENMKKMMQNMKIECRITTARERLGLKTVKDFLNLPLVQKIEANRNPGDLVGEKTMEKLVDELFEKNQQRDLPDDLKTRAATRRFAVQRLAIEMVMGKELPKQNSIFIQRSTIKAASDLFLASDKKNNRISPPFLFFWVDRWNNHL